MSLRSILGAALSVVIVQVPLYAPRVAYADSATTSGEARKEAARAFQEGEKAFKAGDFVVAGEAFDKAYALAPHYDVLWNSARAWQRAGEAARSANLFARFVHDSPPDAADRPAATSALAQLAGRLGKIEVQAGPSDQVWVDGTLLDRRFAYVNPGAHVVRIKSGERDESTTEKLNAGSVVSVAQKPAPVASLALPAQAPSPKPIPSPDKRASHGWSPVVVWVGAGLTLGATGVAVWSGLDTLSAKKSFDAAPTQSELDSGHAKETRTNVLIGVSAGLAVLTGVAAIWLVDWRGAPSMTVGVGPGSMAVRGSF